MLLFFIFNIYVLNQLSVKKIFQGGPHCEVFSPQAKEGITSLKSWKQDDEAGINRVN